MDKAHIDILIQEAARMSYVVLDIGGEKFRVKRKILARYNKIDRKWINM